MSHNFIPLIVRLSLAFAVFGVLVGIVAWSRIGADRVIHVSAGHPTASKPQSKLWYAHGHWWAWLPEKQGSSLWRRGDEGWRRVKALDDWLRQAPGHADVWADDEGVAAVLVAPRQITVARLTFDIQQQSYKPVGEPTAWPFTFSATEAATQCATMARDHSGRWWIAYDHDGAMWVRASRNRSATDWHQPQAVGEQGETSDLSVIFPLADGVGVVWTDQLHDAIYFRRHAHDASYGAWDNVEVLAKGNTVANNHLHAAVASDGTLYVVSKTNRYVASEPLLVLWVRDVAGNWRTFPFAKYTTAITPTRPIVLLHPFETQLSIVHTALDNSRWNQHAIVARTIDRQNLSANPTAGQVIAPHLDLQNATSCKGYLPRGAPWLVLASDRWGNVYEGRLDASPQ